MKFIKSIGSAIFLLLILTMFGSIIYANATGTNSNRIGLLMLMLLIIFFALHTVCVIIRYTFISFKKYGKKIIRAKGLLLLYLLWFLSLCYPLMSLFFDRQIYMLAIGSYYYGTFFILWYACHVTNNCMDRYMNTDKASLKLIDFIPDIYSSERRVR